MRLLVDARPLGKDLLVFVILLASGVFSLGAEELTPSEFLQPWRDSSTAIVIDAYADNEIDWDQMAADPRVVGVIHKATEGFVVDKQFVGRKAEVLRRGYLFGSYHLGRPGDAVKQADQYLATVDPGDADLLALDLEAVGSDFMTLENARRFIERVFEKTGRYPVLYVNHTSAQAIANLGDSAGVFKMCPLWYARFRKDIPDFPAGLWTTYALWQFSSEINCGRQGECLYNVPGTRFDMDVNVFFGTPEALRSRWPFGREGA